MEHSVKFETEISKLNHPSWFTFSRQRRIWSLRAVVSVLKNGKEICRQGIGRFYTRGRIIRPEA